MYVRVRVFVCVILCHLDRTLVSPNDMVDVDIRIMTPLLINPRSYNSLTPTPSLLQLIATKRAKIASTDRVKSHLCAGETAGIGQSELRRPRPQPRRGSRRRLLVQARRTGASRQPVRTVGC